MRCPRCGFDETESKEVWDLDELRATKRTFKDWFLTDTDLLHIEEEMRKAKLYIA